MNIELLADGVIIGLLFSILRNLKLFIDHYVDQTHFGDKS